jgi:hypothetical protein
LPLDLLTLSEIPLLLPLLLFTVASSWLFSLRDWHWVAAYCMALLIAIAGAVYLFRAKLPLYRQGRCFTFGSRHLPPDSIPYYRRGCRLSIIGILLAAALLATSPGW